MHVLTVGPMPVDASQLALMLVEAGHDWQVVHVEDAMSALTHAALYPIDVVLVDMGSPGFDAPSVLAQMREHHPEVVRLLLLPPEGETLIARSLDCAHRFLRAPLAAIDLVDAVEAVNDLRKLLAAPHLQTHIGRIGVIPPPPAMYLRLWRAICDEEATPRVIAGLLGRDPALAAKVLRLANSPYFGAGRPCYDLDRAVVRLGTAWLLKLVLATEAFDSPVPPGIDRGQLMTLAMRAASLARQVLPGIGAELASTAALLAFIGLLIPGVRVPPNEALPLPATDIGPHYAEAGAFLLGLWGLPLPLVEAVATHHEPRRHSVSTFWIAGAVHVACALVMGAAIDEDYLRAVGVADRLDEWRALVRQGPQTA